MLDTASLKLGKKTAVHDVRTLRLADYLNRNTLPVAPPAVDNFSAVKDWSLMMNDSLGDCTIAAAGHLIQAMTRANGHETVLPDSAILAAYEQFCGYHPGDPNSDNGGVMLDVLKDWRSAGVGGHRITGFASLHPRRPTEFMETAYLLCGAYAGVELPVAAQTQLDKGEAWDVPANGRLTGDFEPGSWGGHCIPILAYDEDGLTCITWGAAQRMTWRWLAAYCDEAYAVLSPDWVTQAQSAPNRFNYAQLAADLAAL